MNTIQKKSVLIIANTPGFDLENPNSAVANFIKVIVGFLEEDHSYKVDVRPGSEKAPVTSGAEPLHLKKKPGRAKTYLKKYAPRVYNSLVAYKLLRFQKAQLAQLANKRYDLIIEFYTVGSVLGKQLKERSGAKYMMIYDCPVVEQFREMNGNRSFLDHKLKAAEKNSVLAADTIWCYSPYVKNFLREKFNVQVPFFISPCIVWKPVNIVPAKEPGTEVIGFIGSFLSWHKVDLLVKAFDRIAPAYPALKMVLVGYGQEWDRVKALRDQSPFKDRITMTGYVSDEVLEKLKAGFTIGIMPGSNWYGSPLKLFEYAQCNIPIIAPSTPVVLDLFVQNESALFIDPEEEISSIAAHVRTLLSDKVLADRLAANASALMTSVYSKEHQKQELKKHIQELLSAKPF